MFSFSEFAMKKAKPFTDPLTIVYASGFKSRASRTKAIYQPTDISSSPSTANVKI